MEVHTLTQLLSMFVMTIHIVATYISETSPQLVSSQPLDLQNYKHNLSQETIPRSPHCVVSDNEPMVSQQMVSYIKKLHYYMYLKITNFN